MTAVRETSYHYRCPKCNCEIWKVLNKKHWVSNYTFFLDYRNRTSCYDCGTKIKGFPEWPGAGDPPFPGIFYNCKPGFFYNGEKSACNLKNAAKLRILK